MRPKTLMTLFALYSGIVCIAFLATPAFWITLYGATADPQAQFLYRVLGAMFGGAGLMAWSGRMAEASLARVAMLHGLTAVNVLLAVLAASAAINHVYNQLAWGPAVTFGAFAIGFVRAGRSRVSSSTMQRLAVMSATRSR